MHLNLEMIRILLPVGIIGGIVLFIILRMKHKYKTGTLGRKQSQKAQYLLDSSLPLGMLIGTAVALMVAISTSFPLLSAITWGPGIGLLFGYVVYEISSKKGDAHSID